MYNGNLTKFYVVPLHTVIIVKSDCWLYAYTNNNNNNNNKKSKQTNVQPQNNFESWKI